MAYTIWDERRLHSAASKLDSLAAKYEKIVSDFKANRNTLSGWDSPAADLWRNKCDSVAAEMSTSVSKLRSTASQIRAFTARHHYLLEETIEKITGNID